jgi:hypothetical protein
MWTDFAGFQLGNRHSEEQASKSINGESDYLLRVRYDRLNDIDNDSSWKRI